MAIPSNKILKFNAQQRLAGSENAGKVVLLHTGILTAMALLVTVVNYCLDLQIAKTGGLSNMGLRSILSTVQSVLPMVQSAVMLCLDVGYLAAMLRVSREKYMSTATLRLGFDRFWLLLRTVLLQSCVYMMLFMLTFWLSAQIFMLTPLSDPVTELLTPLMAETAFNVEALLAEPLYSRVVQAMIPMFVLFGALYLAVCLPVSYSLRMVNYVIVDKPGLSGAAVLRASRDMMRGNRLRLLKLDVSLWWWYLLNLAVSALCYGDVLLSMAGIALPFSGEIAYFLFYGLFLAAQAAVYLLLRNRVEVVYAQVYDRIRPREQDTGVVLGNIFQM